MHFHVICTISFSPWRAFRLSCRMITISVCDSSLEGAFETRTKSEYWNTHCLSPARNSGILAISHFKYGKRWSSHVRDNCELSCGNFHRRFTSVTVHAIQRGITTYHIGNRLLKKVSINNLSQRCAADKVNIKVACTASSNLSSID